MLVPVTKSELDLWRNNRKEEAVKRVRTKVTINVAAFSLADDESQVIRKPPTRPTSWRTHHDF